MRSLNGKFNTVNWTFFFATFRTFSKQNFYQAFFSIFPIQLKVIKILLYIFLQLEIC